MRILCPDQFLQNVTDINLAELKARGIKGLLLDLDNTLVGWDSNILAEELSNWLADAQTQGFKLCLVSNGVQKRVKYFADLMGIPAIVPALKPRRAAFRKALNKLQLSAKEVAMIGDQLFTDVLGGNRLGIYTILIRPISKQELRSTKLVRKLEKRVLKRLIDQGCITYKDSDGGK